MKNFRLTTVTLIVIVLLGGLYLLSPEYLRNLVVYQSPDVDDFKIFDNRTVISGAFEPWELEPGFASKNIPLKYSDIVNDLETHALLIIHNKKLIFEKYWEGYSSESKFNSFEMANGIVSLLIGIAIDNGSIESLDQRVGDFIPDFTHGDKSKITIRHLLGMRSGLDWKDDYRKPLSMSVKAYYGRDVMLLALNQDVDGEAGVQFEYMNGNTQLLALVIENATGMSLSAYASQKIWKGIGAGEDALWSLDQVNGTEKAFSCFNSTARDFARIGQLVLDRGMWKENRIVSAGFLEDALYPLNQIGNENSNSLNSYGLSWWASKYDDMEVYCLKGFKGQFLIIVPELDLLILRYGSKSQDNKKDLNVPPEISLWLEIGLSLSGN